MEKALAEKIENLRWKVLEKGQRTKDKRKIPFSLLLETPEGLLRFQMLEDFARQYKFYDALAMWLGQKHLWSESENYYLIWLAEGYLAEEER